MLDQLGLMGLAVSSLAVTLTRFPVGAPFRAGMATLGPTWAKLGTCYYCLSHWIAAPLAVLSPLPATDYVLVDVIATLLALVTVSAIASGAMIVLGQSIRAPDEDEDDGET